MLNDIEVEPYVDTIRMPENVKIGLMISESRNKCKNTGCPLKYYGFAFGQSPFHVPEPITQALCENANKGWELLEKLCNCDINEVLGISLTPKEAMELLDLGYKELAKGNIGYGLFTGMVTIE